MYVTKGIKEGVGNIKKECNMQCKVNDYTCNEARQWLIIINNNENEKKKSNKA